MKGFTLLELLIVISIIGAIAFFAWVGLGQLGSKQNLADAAQSVVALLRDAQQRSITQADGSAWGVRFNNEPTGNLDGYYLFNNIDPSVAVSSFVLDSSLELRQPSELDPPLEVVFKQISGELDSLLCPSVLPPAVIETGIKVDLANSKIIQIFCNGRIEF
ncbi:MAG: prepilin-type N-terminal cleavage/methylation domain-containing protein [Patescibacteria group bacterium]